MISKPDSTGVLRPFAGLRVVVASPGDAAPQAALLATGLHLDGADVRRVSYAPRLPGPFARLANLRQGFAAAAFRAELRAALESGADAIHLDVRADAEGVAAARTALAAAREARARLVLRLSGGDLDGLEDSLDQADAVVAPSPRIQDLVRKRTGAEARVIADLVEDTGYDAPAARRDGPLRVLCARPLEAVHGVDRVLRAAAVAVGCGADVHVVVGGEGRGRRSLERLAGESLPGRVQFLATGAREGVLSALRGSDVLADASASPDPHPSVGDALAEGVPVVAAGGVPDWRVDDEETGLLAAPGDDDALARALERLHADRSALLGLAWRAKIRSLRWTWDALRPEWASVLLGRRVAQRSA